MLATEQAAAELRLAELRRRREVVHAGREEVAARVSSRTMKRYERQRSTKGKGVVVIDDGDDSDDKDDDGSRTRAPRTGRRTVRGADGLEAVLADLEAQLLPLGARPHWGKLFRADAATLAPRYERHADFVALVQRLDPRGAFGNDWLDRFVLVG